MKVTKIDDSIEDIRCDKYNIKNGFMYFLKIIEPSRCVEWGFEDMFGESYHYTDEKYETIKAIKLEQIKEFK